MSSSSKKGDSKTTVQLVGYRYTRVFETLKDAQTNASSPPKRFLARSYSFGFMDLTGARTERAHFHTNPNTGRLFPSGAKPDAGPHSASESAEVTRKTKVFVTKKE